MIAALDPVSFVEVVCIVVAFLGAYSLGQRRRR